MTTMPARSVAATPSAPSSARSVSTEDCDPVSTSTGASPSIRKPAVTCSHPPSKVSIWTTPSAIGHPASLRLVRSACRTWAVGWRNLAPPTRSPSCRIGERLRDAFPAEIWVRGEIQNLTRARSGHVYFTLTEAAEDRNARHASAASLSVVLRAREKERVNRLLLKAGGGVRMTDGTDVRIRGRVSFYAPRGQLQFQMVSIDPAFTLGQLAAARAALLQALRADGLLDRNGRLPMPLLPLRVGLVTSAGSAAEADVLHELDGSGYRFEVRVADVRVQGGDAPGSIAGAIRWFDGRGVDVLLVVRGGGSATDLAAFDQELVARAVAESPIPVIAGVGHEVDRTVVDEVAHTSAKTPTAAARHLVGLVALAHDRAEAAYATVAHAAIALLDRRGDRLSRIADRVSAASTTATRSELARIDHLRHRLSRAPGRLLTLHEERLGHTADRLASSAGRALRETERRVDLLASRTAAVDPAKALARGWSITRAADGTVVRSPDQAPPGTTVRTTLSQGAIVSVVADDPEPPEASE